MSNVGIPGLILLILLVAIVVGVVFLLRFALKKGNSSKEILELKQRISELEAKENNGK